MTPGGIALLTISLNLAGYFFWLYWRERGEHRCADCRRRIERGE